jgi:hypothetical protein
MLISLNVFLSSILRGLSSWNASILGCQQDFVKPWSFVSLSPKEEIATSGGWSFCISNNRINFSNSEVDSLSELILVIKSQPLVEILNGLWLYILADF